MNATTASVSSHFNQLMTGRHCFPGVPAILTLTIFPFLLPLPQSSLSLKGRDLIETSQEELSILWSLILCTLTNCGSLY